MTTLIETTSVSLSPAAAEMVRGLLMQRKLDDSYGLRIFISGQSCSGLQYGMGFENNPVETDTTFESEGLKVIIDEVSLQNMSGAVVEYIDDERGKGFLVENPNVAPACSCGGDGGGCGCSQN
ncbi:MAG: iron-sulfur cluster assembly accessory protein [Anaerolineales bacterium]|jgi:iron-sulfur cluster assembly accessory protein